MIAYSGHFGSGKTFSMTKDLYNLHKRGAIVITNYHTEFSNLIVNSLDDLISMFNEVFMYKSNRENQLSEWFPQLNKSQNYFFAIGLDEAGIYFNSREWSKKTNDEYKYLNDFLLQCRKQKVEIYYTVQHPAFTDVALRRITTSWIHHKVIFPLQWKYDRYITPLVMRKEYELAPESPDLTNPVETLSTGLIYLGNSFIHSLYDSHEIINKYSGELNIPYKLLPQMKFPKVDTRLQKVVKYTKSKLALNSPSKSKSISSER